MTRLSVIVPLAPEETAWKDHLLKNLQQLPDNTEIFFVSPHGSELPQDEMTVPRKEVHFLQSEQGRAAQMNAGAAQATGEYLWFLHADSKFTKNTVAKLEQAIEKHPDALLYSKLKFHNGPKTLKLNAMGANYRSRKHDMPFGDQGICIKKESFNELGGYREDVKFGEDYHFVEDAKVQNIAIRSTGGTLETSGEKYQGQLVRRTLTVKGMLGRLQEERKNLSPLAPIISHNGAANDVAEELTGLDEPTLDHATSQDSQVPPPHGGKNQKISPEKMPQNSTKPANNRPEQRGTERNL